MVKTHFSEGIFRSLCNQIEKEASLSSINTRVLSVESLLAWLKKTNRIQNKEYIQKLHQIKTLREKKEYELLLGNRNTGRNMQNIWTNRKILLLVGIVLIISLSLVILFLSENRRKDIEKSLVENGSIYFSGLLADEIGDPITSKTDVYFRLYETAQGGNSIYKGSCIGEDGITPDHAGKFEIRLGQDCKMKQIPKSIAETSSTVYLGVQIGSGAELSPRQPISTVGYSRDSAHLDGRSVGTNISNILFLDEGGNLAITADSPAIKSTNGIFTIQGEELNLRTTGKNPTSIIFQPGPGSNTVVSTGNFGIGSFEPTNLLTVFGNEPGNSIASLTNLSSEDDKATSVLDLRLGVDSGIEANFIRFFSNSKSKSSRQENTEAQESIGSIRQNKDGVVYETSGADFAEYFHVADGEGQMPGEIMGLFDSGIKRAISDSVVVGVVSDSAGFVGNKSSGNNDVLIALKGQVEVYVTTINGSIQMADGITTSQIPGYGAKQLKGQGPLVGYVLQIDQNKLTKNNCSAEVRNMKSLKLDQISCGKIRILIK